MNVIFEKAEIVSFGKLKNCVVEFKDGINILSAPNESGKSTLASFIKFVLYGFAGVKNRSVAGNERKLYTPWDKEISEGKLYLKADGVSYYVERKCLPSGKETVECKNRINGESAFNGENVGEALFGVGEEVFAQTLFFKNLSGSAEKEDVLAEKLQSIAISADERVGTGKAVSALNDAKNELKGRLTGSGIIPKLIRERDETEAAITESLSYRNQSETLANDIKNTKKLVSDGKKKLDALTEERRNIESYDAKLKLDNIAAAKREYETAEREYESVSAGLKRRGDDDENILRSLFSDNAEYVAGTKRLDEISANLSDAEAELKAEPELPMTKAEASDANKEIEKSEKISKILFIAASVMLLLGVLLCLITKNGAFAFIAAASIVAFVIAFIILVKPASTAKKFGFSSVKELKEFLAALPEKQLKRNVLENKISSLRSSYDECFDACRISKSKLDAGISQYADVTGDDYSEQIETVLRLSSESGKKLAVMRAKKDFLDNLLKDVSVEELKTISEGAKVPARDRQTVDTEIKFYGQQYEILSGKLKNYEIDFAAAEAKSGDPAVLVGKRNSLTEKIDALTMRHNAYTIAAETINAASDHMKSMVAPRIAERAGVYFAAATGDKYKKLDVDTKLSMSFGEDFPRSVEYLSGGTRDSAYLCLRLALSDMLFGGCNVPLVLDDAFDRLDESRLEMMSKALGEAQKLHQIIIMTHSDREAHALASADIPHSEIQIKEV